MYEKAEKEFNVFIDQCLFIEEKNWQIIFAGFRNKINEEHPRYIVPKILLNRINLSVGQIAPFLAALGNFLKEKYYSERHVLAGAWYNIYILKSEYENKTTDSREETNTQKSEKAAEIYNIMLRAAKEIIQIYEGAEIAQ